MCLEELHHLSDMIYVVDIDGYIDDSVKKEIEYAKKHKKEIIFNSKDNYLTKI